MKAQCDRCKEIVLLVFRAEAAGIRVRCPSCAAAYFVPAEPEPEAKAAPAAEPQADADAEAEAPSPPEMVCPKCGEPQKLAESCRRCGLHRDKFAGWDEARADDSSVELGEVRAGAELFAACEADWDDPSRHDAFVAHCQRAGAWAYAAACYRRQTARPDRRAVATARLGDIRRLAEKALAIVPRAPVDKPARNPTRTVVVLAVVVVLLVASIFFITSRLGPSGP